MNSQTSNVKKRSSIKMFYLALRYVFDNWFGSISTVILVLILFGLSVFSSFSIVVIFDNLTSDVVRYSESIFTAANVNIHLLVFGVVAFILIKFCLEVNNTMKFFRQD